jgi:hypothetical protein
VLTIFLSKGARPILQVTVLRGTRDNKETTVSAPKLDKVVCAYNFFKAKPILQATVPKIDACSRDEKV